jgi:HEAT repeat
MKLTWFSVDLCETICTVIPSFVNLLQDGDEDIRSAAISVIVKLAEHGEYD